MNISGDEIEYYGHAGNDGLTYQVVAVTEAENQSVISCSSSEDVIPDSSIQTSNCQFYVIDTGKEFIPNPTMPTKSICPDNNGVRRGTGGIVKKRDERRRATHNEVERRRRDKINHWIMRLANIIPSDVSNNSGSESAGNGGSRVPPSELQSKGGILSRACEYITTLKDANMDLTECLNERSDLCDSLMEENEKLHIELETLRKQLLTHGITHPPE